MPTSTASGAFLNLQPAGSTEIVVHTIEYAGAVEIQRWDGTSLIALLADAIAGYKDGLQFHCTNTNYIRVKSTAATILIAASGMYTK